MPLHCTSESHTLVIAWRTKRIRSHTNESKICRSYQFSTRATEGASNWASASSSPYWQPVCTECFLKRISWQNHAYLLSYLSEWDLFWKRASQPAHPTSRCTHFSQDSDSAWFRTPNYPALRCFPLRKLNRLQHLIWIRLLLLDTACNLRIMRPCCGGRVDLPFQLTLLYPLLFCACHMFDLNAVSHWSNFLQKLLSTHTAGEFLRR